MWFTETPWPPAVALLAAAVVCGVLWSRTRKMFFAALAVACLIAVPIVFVVEQSIVTPAEEVELRIEALRNAVVSDDLDATLEFFSQSAVLERTGVAAGMAIVQAKPDVHVTDVVVNVTANGTLATTHLRANGTFAARGNQFSGEQHIPTRWQVSWRKEAGEWKIYGLDRLDPLTGDKIGILSAE